MVPRIFAAALLALVVGCANGVPSRLASQVRHDWGCGLGTISGRLVSRTERSETYDVAACGDRHFEMTCPVGPHARWHRCRYGGAGDGELVAERTSGGSTATITTSAGPVSSGPSTSSSAWTDAEVQAAIADVGGDLEPCLEGVSGADLALTIDAGGHVQHVGSTQLDATQLTCVRAVLALVDLDGERTAGRGATVHVEGAPAGMDATPAPAEGEADPGLAAEASARAAVDAHRAALLACTGGAAALRLAWSGEGQLSVVLRDAPDSDEERCVQAAMAGVTIDAGGISGTALHAVAP